MKHPGTATNWGTWIFLMVLDKIRMVVLRLIYWIRKLPVRGGRWGRHIIFGINNLFRNPSGFFQWWWTFIIYTLEIFGIGEFYQTGVELFKFNTRPLYDWEIKLGQSVFGDSIPYNRIRVDEKAFIGAKQKKFAYVSFHTINSWGPLNNSTFIHELIHIWQYEKLGAVYMPLALKAQQTELGYNYEGMKGLEEKQKAGIWGFNLEQQGDVVADYYRIQNGYRPTWGFAGKEDLYLYQKFIDEIKEG